MPLLKMKSYALDKPPDHLRPRELVFQVRFTKEIFRNYADYIKKMRLYHQKVWTCKITGKTNLTYEQALLSEREASGKVQQFPREFIGPVLRLIQFSELRFEELVNKIITVFKEQFVPGEEVVCLQESLVTPCKILRVLTDNNSCIVGYEIGWLDDNKNVLKASVETSDRLRRKKKPFTKALLKTFIRESIRTDLGKNRPWLVHDKLCQEYEIPTDPHNVLKTSFPQEVMKVMQANEKFSDENIESQTYVYTKRRKDTKASHTMYRKNEVSKVAIKYPIDDSLVQPALGQKERPTPSSDFILPMHCIGHLLMVWNFCIFFAKAIHLFPFSVEDFEKALEDETEDPLLLRETHNALLQTALTDPLLQQSLAHKRRQKVNVSVQTWKDDIADFLELEGLEKLVEHASAIRNGNYRLLDITIKIDILCELVSHALCSNLIRDELDHIIEEKKTISAQKRLEKVKEMNEVHGKHGQLADAVETSSEINTRVYPDNNDSDESMYQSSSERPSVVVCENFVNKTKDILEEHDSHKDGHKVQVMDHRHQRKLNELQKRREHLKKAIEKHTVRSNSLGMDRDYNRYWFFSREGRVFVEDREYSTWGFYSEKEQIEALYKSLNPKGIREKALRKQLDKHYESISEALRRRRKEIERKNRMEDFHVRRSSRVKHVNEPITIGYTNKYRIM